MCQVKKLSAQPSLNLWFYSSGQWLVHLLYCVKFGKDCSLNYKTNKKVVITLKNNQPFSHHSHIIGQLWRFWFLLFYSVPARVCFVLMLILALEVLYLPNLIWQISVFCGLFPLVGLCRPLLLKEVASTVSRRSMQKHKEWGQACIAGRCNRHAYFYYLYYFTEKRKALPCNTVFKGKDVYLHSHGGVWRC